MSLVTKERELSSNDQANVISDSEVQEYRIYVLKYVTFLTHFVLKQREIKSCKRYLLRLPLNSYNREAVHNLHIYHLALDAKLDFFRLIQCKIKIDW